MKRCFGIGPNADLADAVADLNARLGIPARLGALGVTTDMIPELVSYALTDLAHLTAVKRPTADEYTALVEATL